MEWLNMAKDVMVVAVVPLVFWLRMLITKQERFNEVQMAIQAGIKELKDLHNEQNESVRGVVMRLEKQHVGQDMSLKDVESKLTGIVAKQDVLLDMAVGGKNQHRG